MAGSKALTKSSGAKCLTSKALEVALLTTSGFFLWQKGYYNRVKAIHPCNKEPVRIKQYTLKFCVPKPLIDGFECNELVLYGIRLLQKQFLGTVHDIDVDQSDIKTL